jgi:hypothetical protein
MPGPAMVHRGGVRRFGGLTQPPSWGGWTVTGSSAECKSRSGAVTVSGGGPSSWRLLPGGRVRRSYSWERHMGRRGLAGIEPAGGKRPGRSALPSPLRSHGRGAGYSDVVCGFGQDRPLQAPERLRPAGLHRVYAFSVDPYRMTKPVTIGGVTGSGLHLWSFDRRCIMERLWGIFNLVKPLAQLVSVAPHHAAP